ncbi:MAG: hypothetical protein WCT77_01730 [Bacteroidota bacterium]
MKKTLTKILLLFSIFCITVSCEKEKENEKPLRLKLDEPPDLELLNQEFIVDNNLIWLLRKNGKIWFYSLEDGTLIDTNIGINYRFTSITKDRQNNIVACDASNNICYFNRKNKNWDIVYKSQYKVFGITFDTNNKYYLITNKGIEDIEINKIYSHKPDYGDQFDWYNKPAFITDSQNNIWVGFDNGEWGGGLLLFDTKKKKYHTFSHNLYNPITSIVQGNNNIYVSFGSRHEGMFSGSIVEINIKLKARTIFESNYSRYIDSDGNPKANKGDCISCICYEQTENCLYYYSQKGIFKGNINSDLSNKNYWTKIIKLFPFKSKRVIRIALWNISECKMLVLNPNKIIFISLFNPLGVYNGNNQIIYSRTEN